MMLEDIENLSLAYRLLMHLARYIRFEDEIVCPREMTQRGMADSLRISRSFVSKELKKLVEDGQVGFDLKHAGKSKRQEKAYFLTAEGLNFISELKEKLRVLEVSTFDDEPRHEPTDARLAERPQAAGA